MSDLSTPKSGRLSGRTKTDIDRDFRERCQKAAENILILGYDLIEMKELCEHGEWLEWLRSVGWKERTAQNYMRVSKAWDENPKLMSMGYTRTVALLAAPTELQEQAADGALDDMSAAQIRKLSAQLKKAEEDAQEMGRQAGEVIDDLRDQLADAEQRVRESETKVREYESKVRDQKPVERIVEVEKIPEDYELLKRQLRLAEDAAEDAERRAAEAVQQAQDAMAGQPDPYEGPSVTGFVSAVNAFLAEAGPLPYAEDWLRAMNREDRRSVRLFADSVWHWAENMLRALDQGDRLTVIPGEGAVSGE